MLNNIVCIFMKCRKDFDAEREKDLEKHEKCRKSVDASHEDNTNTEPR